MKIAHLGHACVLVEIDDVRILIDPGTLSTPGDLGGNVDALLFTHSHADHLDLRAVTELFAAHSPKTVLSDTDSAETLVGADISKVQAVDSAAGEHVDAAGIPVEATTVAHATIHCDLPGLANNTYLIADSILHPGDAFWKPAKPVDVLLLPIGGPWMKLSESVDYLRAVSPRVAIPIHQGGLAPAHRALHVDLLRKLGPDGTEVRTLAEGELATI